MLSNLRSNLGQPQTHFFRVQEQSLERTRGNGWRWRLLLSDASDTVVAFSASENDLRLLDPGEVQMGDLVAFESGGKLFATLLYNMDLPEDVQSAHGVELLPRADTPERSAPVLDRLSALVDQLADHTTQHFISRVLFDPAIYPGFLKCPGSHRYHHAFRGGLLAHSVAVAESCFRTAAPLAPDLQSAIVAAGLFHDLGKIRTGRWGSRTEIRYLVPHEAITAELLASHLAWWEELAPTQVAAFRMSLYGYLASNRFAPFVGSDIVRAADQMDTAIDRGKDGSQIVRLA